MKFRLNDDYSKLILKESTREEFNQLRFQLKPYVKNYRFMELYKRKLWDGKIDFFNNGFIRFGLWNYVYNMCKEYGYSFNVENKESMPFRNINKEDFINFVNEFFKNHRVEDTKNKEGEVIEKGAKFFPYDHQIEGAFRLLKYNYSLIEIATAGGKSLTFSLVLFYILKKIKPDAKFLLVVPNVSLVTQFYDDILDYNLGYNLENENPLDIRIQEIMSDKPRKMRDGEPNLYIGTYQSLCKLPSKFFKQFYLVGCDEAHTAKAKTVESILTETFGYARMRVGMSGTFPFEGTAERMSIESLIGPLVYVIKAKDLQEKGLISSVKIKSLILNYKENQFAQDLYGLLKKGLGRKALELEKEYIHNSNKRKMFISKLVNKFESNSLILFHSIEYGKAVYEYLRNNTQNKNFYYIDGETPKDKRNKIKNIMEKTDGNPNILVASYGTLSTGVNIKSISNIVFIDSFKSDQIIRQSIGRGLRLHKEKEKLIVFDIVDRMSNKYIGSLYKQYISRKNDIYKVQQFPFDEIKIMLN